MPRLWQYEAPRIICLKNSTAVFSGSGPDSTRRSNSSPPSTYSSTRLASGGDASRPSEPSMLLETTLTAAFWPVWTLVASKTRPVEPLPSVLPNFQGPILTGFFAAPDLELGFEMPSPSAEDDTKDEAYDSCREWGIEVEKRVESEIGWPLIHKLRKFIPHHAKDEWPDGNDLKPSWSTFSPYGAVQSTTVYSPGAVDFGDRPHRSKKSGLGLPTLILINSVTKPLSPRAKAKARHETLAKWTLRCFWSPDDLRYCVAVASTITTHGTTQAYTTNRASGTLSAVYGKLMRGSGT
ncbi:hypothetical protein OGATHE_003001 [Ogataea polymorpha]|uniref:Uncharacterized protein n=1 Tax=Ogataea polymorpha TaxID=460523 RepID=A0A9P8T8F8_9ASCO|nr:hypothetical protein OGATHE_003001 [Ogataea polymorpha]